MRPPSEPAINKNNPKEWFIYFNHDVPELLWNKYPRKRMRIKVNDDINRLKGPERERFAEERRLIWKHKLEVLKFNPFDDELLQLEELKQRTSIAEEAIIAAEKKEELTPDQLRKLTPIGQACDLWVASRQERTKNRNSVATYRVTATWFKKWFEDLGRLSDPISAVNRLDVATALMARKNAKAWEATTYNNEYDTLINLFNWLAKEEYISGNPIAGRIEKIPTKKHKHKWYDRELKAKVKQALIDANEMLVYQVMQFTYEIMIRSKTEIMKLKAGDIDRTLKRIHFSAELSKNNIECYRDYPPEFEAALDAIDFNSIPKNFYIFGKNGKPSEYKCHKDLFAERWRPIRDELGLSSDYTIYGMKHTRIVHELMKGTEGNDISHMARHEDPKSTKDYQRDYDITLKKVYEPGDLRF